jgi:hypothetical protein
MMVGLAPKLWLEFFHAPGPLHALPPGEVSSLKQTQGHTRHPQIGDDRGRIPGDGTTEEMTQAPGTQTKGHCLGAQAPQGRGNL